MKQAVVQLVFGHKKSFIMRAYFTRLSSFVFNINIFLLVRTPILIISQKETFNLMKLPGSGFENNQTTKQLSKSI